MSAETDLIAEVLDAESQVLPQFTERWDKAKRNSEIANPLKHWTAEERKKIIAQNRIPYAFDRISHPLNILLGTQRDSRFDIQFLEREIDDSHKAEIINAYWKYASDLYDFKHVESDVFQDGIISEYGVYGVDIDRTKDYRGNVKVSRIPYDEVIWDLNFRQYDLSDAGWMSRLRWYGRDDLTEKYPDHKELIALGSKDNTWGGRVDKLDYWFNDKKNLISTREFYLRGWKNKYLIWRKGETEPDAENTFDTKKEAEKHIRDTMQKIESAMNSNPIFAMEVMKQGGLPQFEVLEVPYQTVKKSEIMLNGILQESEDFAPCRFPMVPYFAYFNDGDFWTAIDRMKDPQIFIDRLYSQIDYLIGTQSKGALRHSSRLNKAQKQNIKDNWGKTGFTFEAEKDQIELVQGTPPPFQYFQTIDRVESGMEQQMGGANAQGLQQSQNESGRAVLARQSLAGLDNFVVLDNLKRSKQNLGELIAWYIQNNITEARKLRIGGNSIQMQEMGKNLGDDFQRSEMRPNIGYLTMNTNESNRIEDIELDVIVDEAPHSATKKQGVLNQITDALKGGLPAPPPEVLIPLFELPHSIEQVWLKSIEEAKKQPPPNEDRVSVSFKDLPIEAQAAQLQKMGLPADVQSLIMEKMSKPEIVNNETKMKTEQERNQTAMEREKMKIAGQMLNNMSRENNKPE